MQSDLEALDASVSVVGVEETRMFLFCKKGDG